MRRCGVRSASQNILARSVRSAIEVLFGVSAPRAHGPIHQLELTIEHRAGDEPQVVEIITALGKSITRRATLPVPGLNRPKGMAYFFEMIQGNPLKSKVLIADAVVEAAHDLRFEDYRAARRALDFLAKLRTIKRTYLTQDEDTQIAYHMAQVNHPDPKVCLHEGQKVFLRNQITVKPDRDGPHLTMHFTRLPKG